MRVFQHQWRDTRTGRRGATKNWYVEFINHEGRRCKIAGFHDKNATTELGRRIEQLVAARATGDPLPRALNDWLSQIAPKLRERLIKLDLLPPESIARCAPIDEVLQQFLLSVRAAGRTERHIELLGSRITRLYEGCGFERFEDITASRVEAHLLERRGKGLSHQTSNHYLSALRQFSRWMVREGHIEKSPVASLKPLNVAAARKRVRRALTVEELDRLLTTTQGEPDRYGLSGAERALLYRMAVETGLRVSELASLTPGSFDLGADPSVTVEAGYSKRRRRDRIPLRPALAARLRRHLRGGPANQPTLGIPTRHKTAAMLRADLKAAGIVHEDDQGRHVDFHALRNTFITNLARGGVHPRTAQALARHSTIELTMQVYTDVDAEATRAAVERLPEVA